MSTLSPRPALVALLALAAASCGPCEDSAGLNALTIELALEPASVAFGDVPVGGQRVADVTLRNDGTGSAEVMLAVEPDDAFFDVVSGDEVVVAGGGSIVVRVRFAPLVPGARSAALTAMTTSSSDEIAVALSASASPAPLCDDDNECTDDRFDPVAEACVNEPHARACGGEDQCVEDGVCFEGACLGQAPSCEATSPCRVGFCEEGTGCTEIVPDGACDDDDPCTVDTCTDSGCAHETAPDGTPCGGFEECVSLGVCAQGACVDVEIPDGAPCGPFGDVCAVGTCVDQACEVTELDAPAHVVAQELRSGFRGQPVALGDGRWAVVAPADSTQQTFVSLFAPDANGELERVSTTVVDRECPGACAAGANGVLFLTRLWYSTAFGTFDDDGVFQLTGETGEEGYLFAVPFAGGALHAGQGLISWVDPLAPTNVLTASALGGGTLVAADDVTERAFVTGRGGVAETRIHRVELAAGVLSTSATSLHSANVRGATAGGGSLFLSRDVPGFEAGAGTVERYAADGPLDVPELWQAPADYEMPGGLGYADSVVYAWWSDRDGVLPTRVFARALDAAEWTPLDVTGSVNYVPPAVQGGLLALAPTNEGVAQTFHVTATAATPAPGVFVTGEAYRLLPTGGGLLALGSASGSRVDVDDDGAITWSPAVAWTDVGGPHGAYRGPAGELAVQGGARWPHDSDVLPLPIPTWALAADGGRTPVGALSPTFPAWPFDRPPEETRALVVDGALILSVEDAAFGVSTVTLGRYDLPDAFDGAIAPVWEHSVEHDHTYHAGVAADGIALAAPADGPGVQFVDATDGTVTHTTDASAFAFSMARDASSVALVRPGGVQRFVADGDELVPDVIVSIPGTAPPARSFFFRDDLYVGAIVGTLVVIDFSVDPARTWFVELPETPTDLVELDGRWVVSSPHVVSVVAPPCAAP